MTDAPHEDLPWPGPSVAELNRLREQAESHFWQQQHLARRAGEQVWSLQEELIPQDWSRRSGEAWLHLRTDRLPDADVYVRLGETPDGTGCTGLLIERDGAEVTARDLRQVQLRPLLDLALGPLRDLAAAEGFAVPATRPARPGNVGYGIDHWRDIQARRDRARAVDRRRFVQVMRESYEPRDRPSDATMRRWVRAVERLEARGEL
jgi:hypothetical protein